MIKPRIPYLDTVLDHPPTNEREARVVRLQAFLRSKPLTPAIEHALHRLYDRQQEFGAAYHEYLNAASLTGVSDRSRIDKIRPAFVQARREALVAMGADPDSTDLFPPVPDTRQLWDENRWRGFLETQKPFTPKVRKALEKVYRCAREYEKVRAECHFEAATGGAPDRARLNTVLRRLARTRREALIAMGQDPDSNDLMPPAPEIPEYDA